MIPGLIGVAFAAAPVGPGISAVADSGEVPEEVLVELRAGLALLPPRMRRLPGGPLEIVVHDEATPWGMGDGTRALPDWSDGRRQFHVYAVEDPDRQATWWRRAIVHAVVQRWDDALDLSDHESWRRISGWMAPFERPFVWSERPQLTWEGAYSRPRGMESASLDWVTFAEQVLVPEEGLPADETPRCKELSKSRAFFAILREEDLIVEVPERGPCPAFETWADLEHLSHVEVLFVASTGRYPESLFGHLMMRPVHVRDDRVLGPSFEPVIQPVALTGSDTGGLGYVLRGLTGGFSGVYLSTPRGLVDQQALRWDQRTIRRFRLDLEADERDRLMERLWELERRGYFPYRFFTDNCASAVIVAVNAAVDPARSIRRPGAFLIGPTPTLDAIAAVRNERGPLLDHEPGDWWASGDRARDAHARRRERIEGLPASVRDAWRRFLRDADRVDLDARRAAWERLPALVDQTLVADPTAAEAVYDVLVQTVRIERYALDRTSRERVEVDLATIVPVPGASPDHRDEVAERQALFAREEPLRRRAAALDQSAAVRERLATAERRPYTPREQAVVDFAERTEQSFEALVAIQGELVDERLEDVDAVSWLSADTERTLDAQRARASRSIVGSGYQRAAIGAAATAEGPRIVLATALMREEIGDQRLHGFQPTSELRLLDTELQLEPVLDWPRVDSARSTLASYRTIRRDLPLFRRPVLGGLGWGVGLDGDRDVDRALAHRIVLHADALPVLWVTAREAGFATLGLGAAGQLAWGPHGRERAVGPRLSLSQRTPLPGAVANGLRLEAAWLPAWNGQGWTQQLDGTVRFDLLAGGPRHGLLFSPGASVGYEDGATRVVGRLTVERL